MLPPSCRQALALLLLVFLAGCEMPPEFDCTLTKIVEVPLQVQDRLLVVPVGINGHWVQLVVDSGAERTAISDAAAEQLGLPHDPRYKNRFMGIGGATTTTDVNIERMVMGGVHFPINRIAVGTFNLQNERGLHADGLLGADILLAFDLDIDLPSNKLTLYRSRVCPNTRPPWPEPGIEIIGVRARKDRLLLPFVLDDMPGLAILDTGAQGNVLGVEMATRMGLNQETMVRDAAVPQTGTGPGVTMARLHHFKQLRIGSVIQNHPTMTVLPSDFGLGDALIGEEFLHGRRVWLSFRNRQIFVSRQQNER